MRTSLRISLVFVIILSLSCCSPSTQNEMQTNDELKAIINEKNAKISDFYRKGLVDSLATYFTNKSIQMIPNQEPIRGVEMFKESWNQLMQFGVWDFKLNTIDVKACGNMAVELGKYSLEFTPNENSPMPQMSDKGNYLVLWEKIQGNWQVIWDAPVSEIPLPNSQAESDIEKE